MRGLPWARAFTRVVGYSAIAALIVVAGFAAHLAWHLLRFGWSLTG